jgi:outer membrane protein TolC
MEKIMKRESYLLIAEWIRTGVFVLLLGFAGTVLIRGSRTAEADVQGRTSASAESGITGRGGSEADSLLLAGTPTLDDFRKYAEIRNPELQAARLRWRAARERIPQARALPDPQAGYTFDDMGKGLGSSRHKLEVSQMFPGFGKRELRGEQASIQADIEEQMYQDMKLRLDTMVTEAYAEYYYLFREIAVTGENLKLLGYMERVAQVRYTANKGGQSDVVRAQVEMGKLEERTQTLRDMLRPVSAKLNAALNRPVDALLPAPADLPDAAVTVSEAQLESWMRENNPSLTAAELQIEKGKKTVELARKQSYPDFMLGLGTEIDSESGSMDSRRYSYMGMFSLTIPLWGNKNRAAVNEAKELRRSAEETLANRENDLAAELQAALYRYRDSERKVRLYRDSLLPKARQSLAVSQRAFEVGSAGFLDLVDAQRTLLELELMLERARSDRVLSHAVIAQLTGRDRLAAE